MLDRFDLQVEVKPPSMDWFLERTRRTMDLEPVRRRVGNARILAVDRRSASPEGGDSRDIAGIEGLDPTELRHLVRSIEQLGLSARAMDRVCRIARTMADLDQENRVLRRHLDEALSYRILDRATNPV